MVTEHTEYSDIGEQLKQAPLFRGVNPVDLEALVKAMTLQHFTAGHTLFHKGDVGDTMYIIISGRIRIFTTDKYGNEITLNYLEPPQIFGDFSIVDEQPRSASAMIDEAAALLTLTRDAFMKFLPEHPTVGLAMIRNMADQVRHVTNYLSKVDEAIAQLSVGEYEQAIRQITEGETVSEVASLTKAFIEMIHTVRERETALRLHPRGTE